MNKLLPAGLAFVLAVSATSALACPSGKGGRMMDKVVEKLELTTDQESQFREIMEAKHANMKKYREALRAETLDKLKTVLTEEQLAKYEEISAHRRHHKHKK